MAKFEGEQLSLIAEELEYENQIGDWGRDTQSVPLREKSISEIRAYFIKSARGGQIKNSSSGRGEPLPPTRDDAILTCPPHGGQIKNLTPDPTCPPRLSLFDRNIGDDGTWTETERRGDKVYRYLRWRDQDGTKRSKYLGKLE
jgi:hypothetical protein